jgi:hypothetical protein
MNSIKYANGVRAYGVIALGHAADLCFVTDNFYIIHGIEDYYRIMKSIVMVTETFEL